MRGATPMDAKAVGDRLSSCVKLSCAALSLITPSINAFHHCAYPAFSRSDPHICFSMRSSHQRPSLRISSLQVFMIYLPEIELFLDPTCSSILHDRPCDRLIYASLPIILCISTKFMPLANSQAHMKK